MTQLYNYLGTSRQSVAQNNCRQFAFESKALCLLAEVEELRSEHPGCGLEKMYYTLQPDFIGRDKFIELFMDLGFRLKKRINYIRTTYSVASTHTNLIKGMSISAPCIVWQSDITYYHVNNKYHYVVFLIDVYTKIIVGFEVSDNMRATANLKAMNMAISAHGAPEIHHSDRGSQYNCKEYIKLLNENKCKISMCKSSQDNAYAERINRTIKEEYLDYRKPANFKELKQFTTRAVIHYNNERIHNHLGKLTPLKFIENWQNQTKKNRKIETIFNNELL